MELYVTYHKILDLLQQFQENNPVLKSFGYGNLVEFGDNVSGRTTQYPFFYVVPQSIAYDQNTTTYQLSLLFADRLNEDKDNEKDAVSDMSLVARDFISQVMRGNLMDKMDMVMPVNAIPFMERFNDYVAGVALDAQLIIFEDVNACVEYPTPTPSNTPNLSPTPTTTQTPTVTPTPTDPRTCRTFGLNSPFGVTTYDFTDCDGVFSSTTVSFTYTTICAKENSVSVSSGFGFFNDIDTCPLPTPTNTPTPTLTPNLSATPTSTPTCTPTITPGLVNPLGYGATWWSQFSNANFLSLEEPLPGLIYVDYVIDGVNGSTKFRSGVNNGPRFFSAVTSACEAGFSGASSGGNQVTTLNGDYTYGTDFTFFSRYYWDGLSGERWWLGSDSAVNGLYNGTTPPYRWFQIKTNFGLVEFDVWTDPNTDSGFMVVTQSGLTANTWSNICFRAYQDGPDYKLEVWVNDTLFASTSATLTAIAPAIGPGMVQMLDWETYVAEQFFFSRKLTDQEKTDMFNYLDNRYDC